MAGDLGDLRARISLETKQFTDALQQMTSAVDAQTQQAAGHFSKMTSAVGMVGGALAGLQVGEKLMDFASSSLEASEKLDGLHTAFVNLNGATAETEQVFQNLQDLEAESVFDFEDTIGPASQQMLSFGMSAKDVDTTMAALVNTVAGLRLKPEALESIANTMGKMSQETELTTKSMKALQAEGVPAWETLAKVLGVDVATAQEMVKDGAISGSKAVAALSAELGERFEGAAKKQQATWQGIKHVFSQAVEDIQVAVGTSLGSVLEKVMPLFEKFVGWIKQLIEWFKNAPAPVQTFLVVMGTLAGIVATVAPMIPIITAALGLLATAFSGPVIPILAVVAALAALGVWVSDNWDAIVAVLTQAWDGLQQAWDAVWGGITGFLTGIWTAVAESTRFIWEPIAGFLLAIWTPVAEAFTSAWNGIKTFLSGIWEGIKEAAATVWSGITSAINGFLEVAAKIPGVKQLLNLDEAWASAKRTEEGVKGTSTAMKEMGEAARESGEKVDLSSGKSKAAAKANEEAQKKAIAAAKKRKEEEEKAATRTADAWHAAYQRYEKQAEEQKKQIQWFEQANTRLKEMNEELKKSNDDLALRFGQAHDAMRKAATDTVDIVKPAMDRLPPAIQAAITKSAELETAFKNLGINSSAALVKQAQDATRDYATISASGSASARDIDAAWVVMETARINAAIALGETIPAEQLKALNKVKEQLDTKLPEHKSAWEGFGTSVSTVITNFAQDISKSLWDGELSWGEKGKELLKNLGQAVTSSFIEPATAAINDFISGAIKSLLGGEGLGGVMDKITGIGKGMTDLFGGGEDVIETVKPGGVPSIPGAPKPPTTGAPGGAPAGGGMLGMVNMITGVGSLISSVVGNFQMAGMNKTLDLIENYTRYLKIGLVTQGDSLLNDSHIIRNVMTDSVDNYWGTTVTFYADFAAKMDDMVARLTVLESKAYDAVAYASGTRTDVGTALIKYDDMILALKESNEALREVKISVQATGVTTAEAARELGNQIARNLTTQLVPAA